MKSASSRLSRRTLFTGAATAGALAATASMVPVTRSAPPEMEPLPKPSEKGGYRLSEHVQRYYRTTRV